MDLLFTIIFIIHLGVAIMLYVRRRHPDYLILSGVFFCLVSASLVKHIAPGLEVVTLKAADGFRYAALVLTVIWGGRVMIRRLVKRNPRK